MRPDGRISLPLVPDIVAAGRSPTQLATDITARLRPYVIDPNVTVMVRTFVGSPAQQVRIIGEATQPRTMPYREGMTVVDAVIEARGLTRYAAGNRTEIIRRDAPGATPRNAARPPRRPDARRRHQPGRATSPGRYHRDSAGMVLNNGCHRPRPPGARGQGFLTPVLLTAK